MRISDIIILIFKRELFILQNNAEIHVSKIFRKLLKVS